MANRRLEGEPQGVWAWMRESFPGAYEENAFGGHVPGVRVIEDPDPVAPPMPMRDDAAAKVAQRKSIATQRKRRGRASTILTPFNIEEEGVLGA